MCGEHIANPHAATPNPGSSPHVRGAHVLSHVCFDLSGIIPACAGSTCPWNVPFLLVWDHPRMCGEHAFLLFMNSTWKGSSPHVRGAQRGFLPSVEVLGIIPACAGSTHAHRCRLEQLRDHPRMCGEHFLVYYSDLDRPGSSPHVRGAPFLCLFGVVCPRIIPACAGSTIRLSLMTVPPRDHPRMCGEHMFWSLTGWCRTGSSPHVRGAQTSTSDQVELVGIIPACAGSTLRTSSRRSPPRDHPRMCGEHPRKERTNEQNPGSSPHVRGAHTQACSRPLHHGIIPACAGSTLRK